jgi:hypothetical protein
MVAGMAAVFITGVTLWQKRDLAKHKAAPATATSAAAGGWVIGNGSGGPNIGRSHNANDTAFYAGDGGADSGTACGGDAGGSCGGGGD